MARGSLPSFPVAWKKCACRDGDKDRFIALSL